jgi:hypothetical protein
MASIYINGKCYHVVHNRLEKNHNFNNKYDYELSLVRKSK